jgi:hypothetical protein
LGPSVGKSLRDELSIICFSMDDFKEGMRCGKKHLLPFLKATSIFL